MELGGPWWFTKRLAHGLDSQEATRAKRGASTRTPRAAGPRPHLRTCPPICGTEDRMFVGS